MDKASGEHRYDDWDKLNAEQDALGAFEPVMTHSFGIDP